MVCLTGKETEKEKQENITAFLNGTIQILIAHPESGKFGLSFQNCNYMIYYSRSFSLEQCQQTLERTDRPGQKHTTIYYILNVKNTIDDKITEVLEEKGNISLDLLRNI